LHWWNVWHGLTKTEIRNDVSYHAIFWSFDWNEIKQNWIKNAEIVKVLSFFLSKCVFLRFNKNEKHEFSKKQYLKKISYFVKHNVVTF
jgi:hypothetical protein